MRQSKASCFADVWLLSFQILQLSVDGKVCDIDKICWRRRAESEQIIFAPNFSLHSGAQMKDEGQTKSPGGKRKQTSQISCERESDLN